MVGWDPSLCLNPFLDCLYGVSGFQCKHAGGFTCQEHRELGTGDCGVSQIPQCGGQDLAGIVVRDYHHRGLYCSLSYLLTCALIFKKGFPASIATSTAANKTCISYFS